MRHCERRTLTKYLTELVLISDATMALCGHSTGRPALLQAHNKEFHDARCLL